MDDYAVMSGINFCQDQSPLFGTPCTNMCNYYNDCKIQTVPLLISIMRMKGDLSKTEPHLFKLKPFPIWKSGDINEVTMYMPDGIINEIAADMMSKNK